MKDVVVLGLLIAGTIFFLLSAVAILRMPDLFCRASATAKAATLGVGCTVVAAAVHFSDSAVSARALATLAFLLITSPIAAHMIAWAAYATAVPLWEGTVRDELADREEPDENAIRRQRDRAEKARRAREIEEETDH